MQYYRQILAILGISLIGAIIFLMVISGVVPMTEVYIAIVAALILAAIAIAWWGFKKSIEEEEKPQIVKVINIPETKIKSEFTLVVMPHYKGYSMPPENVDMLGNKLFRQNAIDGTQGLKTPNSKYSSPEAVQLHDSQSVVLYNLQPLKAKQTFTVVDSFVAKLGVIRVFCKSGNIVDCKAEVHIKFLEESGRKSESKSIGLGYLNWHSDEIKHDLHKHATEVYRAKGIGINRFLKNPVQSFCEGDAKYLLMFYMVKGSPNVHLCVGVDSAIVGMANDKFPLKFELEISLTGQNYPKTTFKYLVTAKWDDYKVQQI